MNIGPAGLAAGCCHGGAANPAWRRLCAGLARDRSTVRRARQGRWGSRRGLNRSSARAEVPAVYRGGCSSSQTRSGASCARISRAIASMRDRACG
jgi:hypothetical protein